MMNRFIYLILACLCSATVLSQGAKPLTVMPPSPISASFEKYGDHPVALYTGVPEITIPIYEITSGNIVVPISVSYHASGFKVDDVSDPVGLGWSLSAGGRVSRTVRGKVDEQFSSRGVYPNVTAKYALENLDGESDLFFYQLGAKGSASGRFLFDVTSGDALYSEPFSNPVFLPLKDIAFSYNRSNHEMLLKDEHGNAFRFGGSNTESDDFPAPGHITAWLASEILPASKQQSDKVSFTYSSGPNLTACTTDGSMTMIDSVSFASGNSMVLSMPHYDALYRLYSYSFNAYVPNTSSSMMRYNDLTDNLIYTSRYNPQSNAYSTPFYSQSCHSYSRKNVTTISFKGGRVEFSYDAANVYLNQINVYDNNNALIRTAQFTYQNDGSRKQLVSLAIGGGSAASTQNYRFDYEMGGDPGTNKSARDFWNYPNGAIQNTSPVPLWSNVPAVAQAKSTNGSQNNTIMEVNIGAAERGSCESCMRSGMLKKIYYPTGGYSEFEYEANRYFNESELMNNGTGIKHAGGLRVRRIKTFDGINAPMIKEYTYGITGEADNGVGVAHNIPTYDDYVLEHYVLTDHLYAQTDEFGVDHYPLAYESVYARNRTFLSSPNRALNFIDGCPVWYTYVEERQKSADGKYLGKVITRFSLPEPDVELNYNGPHGPIYEKYKAIARGFANPILSEKVIYNYDGTNEVPVKSYRYQYGNGTARPLPIYPYKASITYNEGVSVAQMEEDDPFYYMDPDKGLVIETTAAELHGVEYILTHEEEVDYHKNSAGTLDSIINSTSYSYGSAALPLYGGHYLLSALKKSRNGGYVETKYKYPPDFPNLSGTDEITTAIRNLQTEHVYSTPVEETTALCDASGNQISVVASRFNTYKPGQPFLSKVYAIEPKRPLLDFSPAAVVNGSVSYYPGYFLKLQADAYNTEGDLLQQHKKDDINTSYLWGYNNMYPVAEIVGADYNSVSAIINQSVLDNPSSDAALRTELNKVRTALASTKASVTTYTYKPLLGMTSQTDLTGKTAYYEYDSLGRLKMIKDKDGHVLKTFDYQYQQTP